MRKGGLARRSPFEREPEKVLDDIMLGKVTEEGATRDYGVYLRRGPRTPKIDRGASPVRRATKSRQAQTNE